MQGEYAAEPLDECIICLDTNETEWIELECGHFYHKKCIQTWMRFRMNCPICIRSIVCEHVELESFPGSEQARIPFQQHQRTYAHVICGCILFALICIIIGAILLM